MRAAPIAYPAVGMLFALLLAPSGALVSLRSPIHAARPAVSARNFAPAIAGAHSAAARAPAPTMQFGRTSRSASPMKRADEPSEEELFGVQLLGGTVGFVLLGPALLGSAVLGLFFGLLLARALVASAGKRGAQAREAGWQTYQLWREGRTRAEAAWETCVEASRERDLPAKAKAAYAAAKKGAAEALAEVRGFDASIGASAKVREACAAVWRRAVAWAEANGAAARASAAWTKCMATWRTSPVVHSAGRWVDEFNSRVDARVKGMARA